MSYWRTVLNEVLNKHNPKQRMLLTNVREYTPPLSRRSSKKKLTQLANTIISTRKTRQYALGKNYPNIYLTPREAQIMCYLLQGRSSKKIAITLELSVRTVEFYLSNMKLKLGCHSKIELINYINHSEFLKNVDLFEQIGDSKQVSMSNGTALSMH